jgi:hypothetical protein
MRHQSKGKLSSNASNLRELGAGLLSMYATKLLTTEAMVQHHTEPHLS